MISRHNGPLVSNFLIEILIVGIPSCWIVKGPKYFIFLLCSKPVACIIFRLPLWSDLWFLCLMKNSGHYLIALVHICDISGNCKQSQINGWRLNPRGYCNDCSQRQDIPKMDILFLDYQTSIACFNCRSRKKTSVHSTNIPRPSSGDFLWEIAMVENAAVISSQQTVHKKLFLD